MNKKIISLLGALALTLTSQATYKSGFYIGANIDGTYDYDRVDETNLQTGTAINRDKKLNSGALQGGLFIGHMHRFADSDLAFSIGHDFNFSSSSKTWDSTAGGVRYHEKLSRNYTGTFLLRFGGILKEEWFLYGLLGLELGRFKFECEFPQFGTKGDCKKTFVGFSYGVGIEKEIWNHWRLGFEVKNTNYCSKKCLVVDTVNNCSNELNPNVNVFYAGLRLTYAF